LFAQQDQGFLAVTSQQYAVAERLEHLRQQSLDTRIIINHQDGRFHVRASALALTGLARTRV
jgi:hypothetical protein